MYCVFCFTSKKIYIFTGWFEEQKPDCKTPLVISELFLIEEGFIDRTLESKIDEANETRTGEIYENGGTFSNVFARLIGCQ